MFIDVVPVSYEEDKSSTVAIASSTYVLIANVLAKLLLVAPTKDVEVIKEEPPTVPDKVNTPLAIRLVGTVSVIISPTSALISSIYATPSMYKSFHSFVEEPISNWSSIVGISDEDIFPNINV